MTDSTYFTPDPTYFTPDPAGSLLSLQDVVTEFRTESGTVRGVDGVSYDVRPGECLGVVGESGSGKSVTMMSALGLLPPSAVVRGGHAYFAGHDLLTESEKELSRRRGRDIGVIFQDPMTALNPVMTIGEQIAESIRRHDRRLGRPAVRARVHELLSDVGIADAPRRAKQYPHQFSGGMRQRVMIAIAIANRPKLIIADEPTTALDVTVQAEIIDLLVDLQEDFGTSIILITHDLGIVAGTCEDTLVMFDGRVMEYRKTADIFDKPEHPYTQGLLAAVPRLDKKVERLSTVSYDFMAAKGEA